MSDGINWGNAKDELTVEDVKKSLKYYLKTKEDLDKEPHKHHWVRERNQKNIDWAINWLRKKGVKI